MTGGDDGSVVGTAAGTGRNTCGPGTWRGVAGVLAAGAAVAAGTYAALVLREWRRYGRSRAGSARETDALLDRFMPDYDVVDRHAVAVAAPAAATLAAAREMDLFGQPLVRPIFRARDVLLGAAPDTRVRPRGLLAETLSLGWGILADVPDREVVVGAVTKPWEPDVTFRAVAPDEFAGFREAGYVKIAWTLRADPRGAAESIFRTETRAVATDAEARARFRRYWAFLSPGIRLIRALSLQPVKAAAERRPPGRPPPTASGADARTGRCCFSTESARQ